MLITSKENPKIKNIKKILNGKDPNYFIIEGDNLIEEAYKNGLLVEAYALENYNNVLNLNLTYVSDSVMKTMTELKSIPRIIGISKFRKVKDFGKKIVLLDDIQDPGNAGAIIRNAVAFDIDTIVFSKNSVKPYNQKVLRSCAGMIYNINILVEDLKDVINSLKKNNIKIYGTALNANEKIDKINNKGFAIIFGNEGHGIKKDIINMCDKIIKINMNSKCESLNVAVSSGIILYELYGGK